MALDTEDIIARYVAETDVESFKKTTQFARDNKKVLEKEMTIKLQLDVLSIQAEIKKTTQAIKTASGQNKVNLELNLDTLKSNLTEAKRQLQNYRNTGDKELSRLQSKFNDVTWSLKGIWVSIKTAFSWLGDVLKGNSSWWLDKILSWWAGAIAGIWLVAGAVGALWWALIQFGKEAAGTSIAYEKAFAWVAKTIDWVADETGRLTVLGKQIKQSFKDMIEEIPIAFEEIASIAELGWQLGIGADGIEEFTRVTALLAQTTTLSSEQAGTALAQLGNVLWLTADDYVKVANVIVDLWNNSATTETQILEFAQRLAPVANTLQNPIWPITCHIRRCRISGYQRRSRSNSDTENTQRNERSVCQWR